MADFACGTRCAKIAIVAVNVVLAFAGFSLLLFGITMTASVKMSYSDYLTPFDDAYSSSSLAFVVITIVGFIIMLSTFIGCCAVVWERSACFNLHVTLLVALLVPQIAVMVFAAVFPRQHLRTDIEEKLLQKVQLQYGVKKKGATKFIDNLQSGIKCCGVTKQGPLDWTNSTWYNTSQKQQFVPDSCCAKNDANKYIDLTRCHHYDPRNQTGSTEPAFVYTTGCGDHLDRILTFYTRILIGVSVGAIFIQIVLITMVSLAKNVVLRRRKDYDTL